MKNNRNANNQEKVQPVYRDGLSAWAVHAVCTGGQPRTLATTYVRARDGEHAADVGREALRLRSSLRNRRGWTVVAQPAHAARDLGMVPIEGPRRIDAALGYG